MRTEKSLAETMKTALFPLASEFMFTLEHKQTNGDFICKSERGSERKSAAAFSLSRRPPCGARKNKDIDGILIDRTSTRSY